jgi:hypothetical protein|tara:strand:+ start:3717 stop:3905 length:189 start_codon:yes stop_codon:yes gene_type:complete
MAYQVFGAEQCLNAEWLRGDGRGSVLARPVLKRPPVEPCAKTVDSYYGFNMLDGIQIFLRIY